MGFKSIVYNLIIAVYCSVMLRNKCIMFMHFGNMRIIQYVPSLMFPEFNSVQKKRVKVLQELEQE